MFTLKKYFLTFVRSLISTSLFHFLNFEGLMRFIGITSLVLELILSGTMVSGD